MGKDYTKGRFGLYQSTPRSLVIESRRKQNKIGETERTNVNGRSEFIRMEPNGYNFDQDNRNNNATHGGKEKESNKEKSTPTNPTNFNSTTGTYNFTNAPISNSTTQTITLMSNKKKPR